MPPQDKATGLAPVLSVGLRQSSTTCLWRDPAELYCQAPSFLHLQQDVLRAMALRREPLVPQPCSMGA